MSHTGWYTQNVREYPGAQPKFVNDIFCGWRLTDEMSNDYVIGLVARQIVMTSFEDIVGGLVAARTMGISNACTVVKESSMRTLKDFVQGNATVTHFIGSRQHCDWPTGTELLLIEVHHRKSNRSVEKKFFIPTHMSGLSDHTEASRQLLKWGKQLARLTKQANEHLRQPSMTSRISSALEHCALCSAKTNLMRCGRCRRIFYCSKDHQVKDWAEHKAICRLSSKISQQMNPSVPGDIDPSELLDAVRNLIVTHR